jgi:flagellar protein FlaG
MTDTTHIAQAASQLGRVTAAPSKVAASVWDRQEVTAPSQSVLDRQEVKAPTRSVFGEPAAKAKEATADEQTTAAVVKLNDYMQQEKRSLQFSVDAASGRTVITVTDVETKQVIRQIPPERILAIMHSFAEGQGEAGQQGLLVRETV